MFMLQIEHCDADDWSFDDYPKTLFEPDEDDNLCTYYDNIDKNSSGICFK